MSLSVSDIAKNAQVICALTDDKKPALEASILSFGISILESFEWSFLDGEDTDPSIANVNEYILTGAANDCGIIQAVYYAGKEVTFKDSLEFDRLTKPGEVLPSDGSVVFWTRLPGTDASSGFPTLKLFGTPSRSGDEIYYSYRRLIDETNPLKYAPAAMRDLFECEAISRFHPNPNDRFDYSKRAEKAINYLLKRYRKTTIAHRPGRIDPLQRARNYEINMLGGYRHITRVIVQR